MRAIAVAIVNTFNLPPYGRKLSMAGAWALRAAARWEVHRHRTQSRKLSRTMVAIGARRLRTVGHSMKRGPEKATDDASRVARQPVAPSAAEYFRAVVQVRSMGQVVKTRDGNAIQNQYLSIMNPQALLIVRFGAEMSFCLAARASPAPPPGLQRRAAPRWGDELARVHRAPTS
jgi:hypothetical protein